MRKKNQRSNNSENVELIYNGKSFSFPLIKGSEGELGFNIKKLREETGLVTYDPGFANTATCLSEITFVDGEKGILRYRGYNIEDLANSGADFVTVAYLINFGELPKKEERDRFRSLLTSNEILHEDMREFFNSLPPSGDPMAILSAAVQCSSLYYPELRNIDPHQEDEFMMAAAKLLSKIRTIAAFSYRKSLGLPIEYPCSSLDYCRNFLHMMFSKPYEQYIAPDMIINTLNLFFILHADHEQNCSTTTTRMVESAGTNLFDSVSAGICALSGPLHGGANLEVIRMLEKIQSGEITVKELIRQTKSKKKNLARVRLSGFGHRVYKSYDPRAKILKKAVDSLMYIANIHDPLIDIAIEIEQAALKDEYFIEKKLYPNVDFYSGILLRMVGIPPNMYPVMFAISRVAGWIAHWWEGATDPEKKIYRPRQIYFGKKERILK